MTTAYNQAPVFNNSENFIFNIFVRNKPILLECANILGIPIEFGEQFDVFVRVYSLQHINIMDINNLKNSYVESCNRCYKTSCKTTAKNILKLFEDD